MNRGNIKIKETNHHQFIVEAQLVNGNLWLTKHEIADLFDVSIGIASNNLHAIFKSGVLREEDVTRIYLFDRNGKPCHITLYNLEVLIFVSYRIASFEARAFRQWVMKAFGEYTSEGKNIRISEVLITYNSLENLPSIIHIN